MAIKPGDMYPEPTASRRELLRKARRLGWVGLWVWLGACVVGIARFFFPRLVLEPPTHFRAGFPQDYRIGRVDTRHKARHGVWIVRDPEGIYVLLARCTHLGCTPDWLPSENKFKCPCHGSGFTKEGLNYEGPAPRPLERLKLSLTADGELLIDKGKVFRHERGEWEHPDAFLRV